MIIVGDVNHDDSPKVSTNPGRAAAINLQVNPGPGPGRTRTYHRRSAGPAVLWGGLNSSCIGACKDSNVNIRKQSIKINLSKSIRNPDCC